MFLKNSKNIVIKIGSSLLVDKKQKIRKNWLLSFAKDIKKLMSKDKKVTIVSSGAIALGCKKMNYKKTNLKLDKSQAVASIGQIELMNLYSQAFSKCKINISQILLTLDDTEERRRSINAKRTFENLFQLNYLPIVNENDTIATSEIKYGDNDRLASRVAQITDADTLILLSDVDGLYTKNPKIHKDAKLIKKVFDINKELQNISIKGTTEYGSGGMDTKIEAAKISNLAGCNMIIANGLYTNPITQIDKKNNSGGGCILRLFATTALTPLPIPSHISSEICGKSPFSRTGLASEYVKIAADLPLVISLSTGNRSGLSLSIIILVLSEKRYSACSYLYGTIFA